MTYVVEEQFGSTVPILLYDDEDRAIQPANHSLYGLTSSVWGNPEHAIRVARRIEDRTRRTALVCRNTRH
nr:aldehyde dehydrogenase family protein [Alicyclobacillus suci]